MCTPVDHFIIYVKKSILQWRSKDFSYGGAHEREARHLGGCGGMPPQEN